MIVLNRCSRSRKIIAYDAVNSVLAIRSNPCSRPSESLKYVGIPRGNRRDRSDNGVGRDWSIATCVMAGSRDLRTIRPQRDLRSPFRRREIERPSPAHGRRAEPGQLVSTDFISTPSARHDELVVANQSIRGQKLDADSPAYGVRPSDRTGSSRSFDHQPGVLVLELLRAEIAERAECNRRVL